MGIPPPRPLAGVALVFVAGTGLGLAVPVSLAALFSATGLCLILALLIPWAAPRSDLVPTMLHLAVVLGLGWINASREPGTADRAISSVLHLPTGGALCGIVTDEPVCVSTRKGKATWKFPIRAEQIRGGGLHRWTETSGTVRIRLFAEAGDRIPSYGERWSFSGYIAQATYKQGFFAGRPGVIYFSGSARKARYLAAGIGNPLVAVCLRGRAWAAKILSAGITDRPEQGRILNSILLGYYSQIPRDLYQAFAATGTLHVFAISGSHVVIFAGAIIFILAACGLPRTCWVLFLGPLLILYTAMTGLQPSAIRACIMGIIYWTAPLIGRKPDIYTTLAVSAILILAICPEDLVNIGFLLSYTAVLGLVLLCPVFSDLLRRCFLHDPLKLEPDPRWQEMLRSGWHGFSELFSVSLAAWLVTTPLTLLFFGTFSPIGLPANLLVVPLSSLVIITGVLSLVMGSCFLFLADLFNHANLALIILMTESARWFAAIPHGCLKVEAPPLWLILVFYAGLLTARFTLWVYGKEKAVSPIESEE